MSEPELDGPQLVVSLTPKHVLVYGIAASLILFAAALAAMWAPALHLGPGIDALSITLAWLASVLAVVVQVGAAATAIRLLGSESVTRPATERSLVDRRAMPSWLPASPASVVEHTTFRLTAPGALPRARTTADQG